MCLTNFFIGPFVPAIFALFTIVTGQLVMNTWNLNGEQCGYALNGISLDFEYINII